MNNNILAAMTKLLLGTLYFTETESTFTVTDWGKIPPTELLSKIAARHHSDASHLKQINPADFFDRLVSKVDAADAPMVENAQKIQKFYTYLTKNLSSIQVVRVEGNSKIPVLITGYLADGTCVLIETLAVET
ncbi:nuclease A inhibitor family protein [Pedobacter psychrotolerans]|uniref:nuclease A inhibitor family protein n=1 Tax=Pedobacter psychrotolerans TaxID=1843235 RepID=UPI003F96E791